MKTGNFSYHKSEKKWKDVSGKQLDYRSSCISNSIVSQIET